MHQALTQVLLLLVLTVPAIILFQRLRIPSSLAYLAVGVVVGGYTAGPVVQSDYLQMIAEFGVVFLLFTIGLNFTVAQIYAMRHALLGLGTGQVFLTALLIGGLAWLAGLPPAAAFVAGAVFAQSSTTIISRQLAEQGEEGTRHGRLGVAMSVFQDVTAVPFLVIIPVLGLSAAGDLGGTLGITLFKALLALALVLLVGRYLLRPLLHQVAILRSAELFSLSVLLVSLAAAWTTQQLGLSMAFGAFLAGMVLGDTEFRHQVEATIRPYRDVLLGLFFISIGMLVQPALFPQIWREALVGALALLLVKLLLVSLLVRSAGFEPRMALRTGLLLAVGGEFGFALLAIALDAAVIEPLLAQTLLASVLLSMVVAPFMIRYNLQLSAWLADKPLPEVDQGLRLADGAAPGNHVILCGYGRTGQMIGHFLDREGSAYLALDTDAAMVGEARLAGQPVYYADATTPSVLEAAGLSSARLLIISHDDRSALLRTLACVRQQRPDLPILVRARDESWGDELRAMGASEVIPETLEAGITMASHALLSLGVPQYRVSRYLQEQRSQRYPMLRELFRGPLDEVVPEGAETVERLHSVRLEQDSAACGRLLGDLPLGATLVSALVRDGQRTRYPAPETRLQAEDVLVLLGSGAELENAERRLTRKSD
ncbi:cation:proton antiporter [Halopseudomonas yangmingensis]|uniref:Monovalent cation:H+ antiporter-2, CPA2 family n=1 Tax=Halopseudomonas yangmingensis TaxID=1720063 RepID=A0A1I4T7H7_9GAMM|nr:cation:proton antiporter [Halopseudomonas yangmingensis]SFM72510.1 monovalent cation:H+ antiporter-2, CPA2 family [Halopseudomonas yangmingensis]